jgi:hypothetical protein
MPQQPESLPLDAIAAPSDLPVEEDVRASRFEADLAEQQARYLREENENLRTTREMRQTAARSAFYYLCVLSGAVFFLLLADGFHLWGFHLDRVVLTTLAGGTFVSAIGLFGIVVKGLFPMNQPTRVRATARRIGRQG